MKRRAKTSLWIGFVLVVIGRGVTSPFRSLSCDSTGSVKVPVVDGEFQIGACVVRVAFDLQRALNSDHARHLGTEGR